MENEARSEGQERRLFDDWPPREVRLLPPPARASGTTRIFAQEIVLCMLAARPPAPVEIECVAARIWSEIQAGPERLPWHGLARGSNRRRKLIRAARFALGDIEDSAGSVGAPSEDSALRERLVWPGMSGAGLVGRHRRLVADFVGGDVAGADHLQDAAQ